MKNLRAFTLAEVLIALGIIGVVSAMTLPTLINKYQKYVIANQIKTAYSLIQSSINTCEAGLDDPKWRRNLAASKYYNYTSNDHIDIFNNYIICNLKKVKDYGFVVTGNGTIGFPAYKTYSGNVSVPSSTTGSTYYVVELKNGIILYMRIQSYTNGSSPMPVIYTDVNGRKGPNVFNKDMILFTVDAGRKLIIPGVNNTRENIAEDCNYDSTYIYGTICASLIQKDGWVIKDDYKW